MKSLYKILFVCLAVLGFSPITQAQMNFEGHLSGSNEVPSLTTTATGSVMATLNGNELTLEGSFEGLKGDYVASHIHFGMAGQAGGVLAALTATVDTDSKGGMYATTDNTIMLTSGQVDTLLMHGLYVNIHSTEHEGGELRAQLVPESDAHFRTNLSGAFEWPAAKTQAYGGLVFQMKGDTLIASGSFSNLSGDFDASIAGGTHLHIAPAGMNGDVSIPLNATVDAEMKSGVYLPSENRFELSSEQKNALMNRMFYVNIHTTSFASGELRGQLIPPVTASFYAGLSGSAELPSVRSQAKGAVIAELHGDSLFVSGSFSNLESDFDASIAGGSHIHAGHAGENGSVDLMLTAEADAELRSGTYHATENSFELTAEQKATLMARGYYVNIHTMENAGGELRGQILGDATAYFKTSLSGMNEIQPILTDALGAINVEVSGETAIVSGGFADLSSMFDASVAGGAHLHNGAVNANGDVEVMLNTSVMSDTAGMYDAAMNTFVLTEAQLMALYDEEMYANIHTEAFAGGELRGQLLFGENYYPDSSMILTPAEDASLSITGDITTMFEATWEMVSDTNGNDLNYIWQLSTDSAFTDVIVNASVGAETSFMTDFGTLDDILSSLEIEIGGNAMIYHRVGVSDGSNQTFSEPRSAWLQRGTVTANEEISENPEEFGLDQNYPNPFNPSTTISFSLEQSGMASVKVFNMLGQEVATLANDTFTAGSHTVTFNASELASGIYIYRLRAGEQSMTRKMMLVK